jgi:hypothetical protein
MNCASVNAGLFFLQICGIKFGEVSCTISLIYTRITKNFPIFLVKRTTKNFQKKKLDPDWIENLGKNDIILNVLIFQNPPELPVLVFLGNSPK